MKTRYKTVFTLALMAIAVAVAYNITGKVTDSGRYDELAKCLSSSGVKMYGAYWCPQCNELYKEPVKQEVQK